MKNLSFLLFLVVAAGTAPAQIVVKPGLDFEFAGTGSTTGLTPLVEDIHYGSTTPKDHVNNSLEEDEGSPGNAPFVYPPISESVAIGHELCWSAKVKLKAYTMVDGKIEADISTGLGYGTTAVGGSSEAKYGGLTILAQNAGALGIMTIGTSIEWGAGFDVSFKDWGIGAQFGSTYVWDQNSKQEKEIDHAANGSKKCVDEVTTLQMAKGELSMTLHPGAKGRFSYEMETGILVRIYNFCVNGLPGN